MYRPFHGCRLFWYIGSPGRCQARLRGPEILFLHEFPGTFEVIEYQVMRGGGIAHESYALYLYEAGISITKVRVSKKRGWWKVPGCGWECCTGDDTLIYHIDDDETMESSRPEQRSRQKRQHCLYISQPKCILSRRSVINLEMKLLLESQRALCARLWPQYALLLHLA